MKKIIFHHPLPLLDNPKSASGIRPKKMLKSFQELGYEVDVISGYSKDRARDIARIKKKILNGVKYDFVYSESSTMPTILTDKHHLPLNPFLEYNFFKLCKKHNIPVGLFYRDIYWRFDGYGQNIGSIKSCLAKFGYWYDLLIYKKFLARMYLPSIEMAKYIPLVSKKILTPLPPGADILKQNKMSSASESQKLKIFYVGGMTDNYKMHVLFEVASINSNIDLTVCTRKEEWEKVHQEYPSLTPNIHVVHKVGDDVVNYLKEADILSLFVEPLEYREFASPVKLYEYLGAGKPILASSNTLSGNFVLKHNVGWAIEYDADSLNSFFKSYLSSRDTIDMLKKNVSMVAVDHTWQARVTQVSDDLTSIYDQNY